MIFMNTSLTSPRAGFAIGESATPFADLAERVATGDLDLDSGAFTALVTAARRRRASDVLIGVLLDPAAPAVARQRAFGRLAAAVAAPQQAYAHRAA
jgi:hypothetical protein